MQEKPNSPKALDYESPPRKEKHAAWIILAVAIAAVIVVLGLSLFRSQRPPGALPTPTAATSRPA